MKTKKLDATLIVETLKKQNSNVLGSIKAVVPANKTNENVYVIYDNATLEFYRSCNESYDFDSGVHYTTTRVIAHGEFYLSDIKAVVGCVNDLNKHSLEQAKAKAQETQEGEPSSEEII